MMGWEGLVGGLLGGAAKGAEAGWAREDLLAEQAQKDMFAVRLAEMKHGFDLERDQREYDMEAPKREQEAALNQAKIDYYNRAGRGTRTPASGGSGLNRKELYTQLSDIADIPDEQTRAQRLNLLGQVYGLDVGLLRSAMGDTGLQQSPAPATNTDGTVIGFLKSLVLGDDEAPATTPGKTKEDYLGQVLDDRQPDSGSALADVRITGGVTDEAIRERIINAPVPESRVALIEMANYVAGLVNDDQLSEATRATARRWLQENYPTKLDEAGLIGLGGDAVDAYLDMGRGLYDALQTPVEGF